MCQAKIAVTPFKIAIAPVLLIIAGFDSISFGFYVALNALTPVWLQLPIKAGGLYGFSVTDNANCESPHICPLMGSARTNGGIYSHLHPLDRFRCRPTLRTLL
jgi:hypothetical protein